MARSVKSMELSGQIEKYICRFPAGTFLPPEQKLAEKFGVSRPTLRRAEDELVMRGFLIRRNGVGREIAAQPKGIGRSLIFLCRDLRFFAQALHSFCRVAEASNYFCSVVPLSGDKLSQERIMETILLRNPAGIAVYADPEVPCLDAFSFPEFTKRAVFLVRRPPGTEGDLVGMNSSLEMTRLVQLFYRKGCRKFALYGVGSVNEKAAEERSSGFLEGLKKCRLKVRNGLLCRKKEERKEFFRAFSQSTAKPDAVCCLNDLCAGDFMREAEKRGIDLKNVKISGFDNLPLNSFLPYPITTVEQPLEEVGRAAAEMLVRRVENPGFAFHTENIKSKIVNMEN